MQSRCIPIICYFVNFDCTQENMALYFDRSLSAVLYEHYKIQINRKKIKNTNNIKISGAQSRCIPMTCDFVNFDCKQKNIVLFRQQFVNSTMGIMEAYSELYLHCAHF